MKKSTRTKKPKKAGNSGLPAYVRKELWVEVSPCEDAGPCSGRHFILGARPTFPGRFAIYCPGTKRSFRSSLYDVKRTSPQAKLWLEGFMYGSEPPPPSDIVGFPLDDEHPLTKAFEKAATKYRKSGRLSSNASHPWPWATALNWMLQVGVELDVLRPEDLATWAKNSLPGEKVSVTDESWDRRFEWLKGISSGKSKHDLLKFLKSFGSDAVANESFNYLVALATDFEKKSADNVPAIVGELKKAADVCLADDFWKDERTKVITELNAAAQNPKMFEAFKKKWAPADPEFFRLAIAPIRWSSSK